jgi:hypothetical protein
MMIPVTSTSVATNGADDVAGSNPSFFMRSGSIDPLNVPHITTPINEVPIVSPISMECSP